jgi:hypothetical protein
MESNKEELLAEGNKRSVIIQFYFDETNKFHKTVEEFRTLLRDSLKLPTDINIIYKFQKTKGSVFINNGTEKLSIIHLNALIYSMDSDLLKELFGKGKLSRIDTTSSKLKNFTHEFIPFNKISDDDSGYLFLYRGKLIGKGFACDPNEDVDIVGTFKKIYDRKYVSECEKKSEEEEEARKDALLASLKKSNDELKEVLNKFKKKVEKSPKWTLFSNFDYQVGSTSTYSDYVENKIRLGGQGISSSAGFIYFINGSNNSNMFLTSSINIGSASFDFIRKIDYEFKQVQPDFTSISLIQNYNEEINSSFVNIPFGVGYQLRETSWPIYFQFSANGIIGFNKLNSNNGNGIASYRRLYNESGIVVIEQPQHGLEDNVLLTGKPEYNNNISLTYGAKIDMKILYNFNNSPLSGFIDFGFNYSKTNTSSNGSVFISEFKNDQNSILNSMKNLGSLPIFVGLGISYDLRNKINIE